MTPREQIEKAMKESVAETIYASGWGITPKATDLLECAYTEGAEYGYNLAIEKVFELLENIDFEQRYLDSENLFHKEQFIENLKQAMKL